MTDFIYTDKLRDSVVNVARMELGTKESPPNSNQTKYGKWFGFDGVPWCGIFVSYCFYHGGAPLPNIGFLKGFAGCQTAIAYFKKHDKIVRPELGEWVQKGDIVFFDWNMDGRVDHVGIFTVHMDDEEFSTIEGNTSYRNQSNGGQVMARERKYNRNAIFVNPFK